MGKACAKLFDQVIKYYLNADSDLYITNEFNPETNIFSSDEKLINDLLHNFNNNK